MPITISPDILLKLEHDIPEIRCRALYNVQSKFQSCCVDLNDLIVNVHDLIGRLFGWFNFKPVTHQKQVFDILLTLLKSKYFQQTIQILSKYGRQGELKNIGRYANDEITRSHYNEILSLVKNNDIAHTPRKSEPITSKDDHNLFDDIECNEFYSGLQFESAWDLVGPKDRQRLLSLKTSLSIENDANELDHAMEFFKQTVHDFPGEYFLQSPFIFVDLLRLLQSDDRSVDKTNVLTSMLYLTRNLSRRVSIGRISFMYCGRKVVSQQQVTIASYSSSVFSGILEHLRQDYTNLNLINLNECFLILIEIVELICKSAVEYTPETSAEYAIDRFIAELTDFLKFLRETTMNYRKSSNKIDRNTSISILYLLCRLLLFKDNNQTLSCTDVINDSLYVSPSTNISTMNLSQRLKEMSLNKDMMNERKFSHLSNRSYYLDLFQSTINDEISTAPSTTTENFVTALEDSDANIHRQELETALFDYSLTHFYPDVHELVSFTLKVKSLPSQSITNVLLNLDKILKPIIVLLKDPHICSDEFILKNSSQSVDILPLIKSDGLTALIFNAISNLSSKYDQDLGLLEDAERVLLSMLSTECADTKRLIYKMISDKVTHVFSYYMDGTMIIPKAYDKSVNHSTIFGLPLTTDILVEIICFGLTNGHSDARQYAENVLLIILRSAKVFNDNWNKLLELLVPALPLLSCFSNTSSTIGRFISSLFEPDVDNGLSTVQLFKNNIAQLYCHDPNTRNEAITRILYLLQCLPNSDQYVPNINYLANVIPDNICIVKPPNRKSFEDFVDLFERSLARQLLDGLLHHPLDPSTRQTTLNQLNIMMEDLSIAQEICQQDGVRVLCEIWERSLRIELIHDYTNDAIQIVSILSKISHRMPSVRRRLSSDIQTYNLLLRTMLANLNVDTVQRDCASLLFLLAFSDHIIGCISEGQLSIPVVCKKLSVPIDCQHNTTPIIAMRNDQGLFELVSIMMKAHTTPLGSDSNDVMSVVCDERPFLKITDLWRYVRMTFAALWFGTLDNVLIETDNSFQIKYQLNEQSIHFNKALCMTRSDLEIIEATSPHIGIEYWQKQIQNATSVNQVVLSCAAIENFSTIDSSTVKRQWNVDSFLQAIKRFCTIAPRNKQDEFLFSRICRLLAHLINQEYENIHAWLLYQLQEECIYIDLMTNRNASTAVYLCNILFVESIIAKAIQLQTKTFMHQVLFSAPKMKSTNSKLTRNNDKSKARENLFDRLLNIAVNQLDELLSMKKSDELFQLISLIRTLTSSGQITVNDYDCSYVANKLMKLILATKTFTQIGSNFNKNCLLAIGNLTLNIDDLILDQKYISLLSSLCGHCDFEIRAYSWTILLKIATTLKGAELLVKELKCLPGGFYACCVSTLFDEYESAVVRENAAFVFAALISHRAPDGNLNKNIVPSSASSTFDNDWLDRLLEHNHFFDKIIDSTNYLHFKETINPDEMNGSIKVVPCNLIRAYCVVLTHLMYLKMDNCKAKAITAMLQIYKIIPQLAGSINKSSVLLMIELCDLMSQCISKDRGVVEQISTEFKIVQSLISCLSIKPFETISDVIKNRCWSRILKVLRNLVHSPMGFQIMCESFAQSPNILEENSCLFIYGLANKEINIAVMKYMTKMLIMSQSKSKFPNFSEQLNALKITSNAKKTIQSFFYKSNVISQTLGDWLENADNDKYEISFACVLFEQLSDLFEKCNDSSTAQTVHCQKNPTFEYLCHFLSIMLKCSVQFRESATSERFILTIVQQMEQIYDSIDGSFTDYIRRNGSSKAEPFLNRLKMLLSIVLSWYSSDCLQNIDSIRTLVCICHKFWPTIGVNADLQLRMMNMLLFISDDSLPVCKQLASNGSHSGTFLQSIIDFAINETSKAKSLPNLTNLEFALKIVSNCCSCIEGRILVNKLPMLDTLSRLHPQVTRNQKPWPQITLMWLEFFEVLTRYEDSSKVVHINLLVNFAESGSKRLRQQTLEILRNMTFNTENRSTFLNSKPFINIVISTLDRNIPAEQLLVTVSIWKLIANNYKAKNAIKNCPIYQKLRRLKESIVCTSNGNQQRFISNTDNELDNSNDETNEDLLVALECVTDILQA